MMRALLLGLALVASGCSTAWAKDKSYFDGGPCPVLGADGGVNLTMQVNPGAQFQVSVLDGYTGVTYRLCTSASCLATGWDSPVASGQQVDLCGQTGYPYLSFNKGPNDGGDPHVCVYDVSPRTVCPSQ